MELLILEDKSYDKMKYLFRIFVDFWVWNIPVWPMRQYQVLMT